MRTPVSRRQVRAAVFVSPLIVAAVLAPSSALAALPTVVSLTGPTSVTNAGPATYTATATDPDDSANLLTPGANLTYTWTLDGIPVSGSGDGTGTSSITVTPPHGQSTVAVTVTAGPVGLETANETSAPSSLAVLANRPPSAPTITVPPVKAGVAVTLTANATDPDGAEIVGYTWNLGDNVPQNTTGNTITTSFAPGTYIVSVDPHDAFGGSSSASTPAFTVVNQPPRAKLTASPNPVGVGKVVTLSGIGSTDFEGSALSFSWDLGLGTFGTFTPIPTTTTTFDTPGAKTVQLDVKDQFGATDPNPDAVSVTVSARQPPAPNFEFSPSNPVTDQEVTFTSTTAAGEQPVKSLDWDLNGDGIYTDAAGSTVVAKFPKVGLQTVTLRATDTANVVATAQKVINVTAAAGTNPGTGTASTTVSSSSPTNSQSSSTTPSTTTSANSNIKAKAALISPFPTVRIRGLIIGSQVKVSLLSVTSKVGVSIKVLCSGKGCPKKAQTKTTKKGGVIRFSALKRTLGNGAIVRVYVSKKGQIGKYTRFRIQKGKAPVRVDMCLPANGSSKPRTCPLPT